jgi:hypothetical protein
VPGKEERSEAEIVPRDPSKVADRLRFLVGLAGGIAALLGLFALLLFVVLEPGYDVFLSRLGVRPEDVGVDYIRAVTRGGYAIGLVAVELGLSALAATLVLAVVFLLARELGRLIKRWFRVPTHRRSVLQRCWRRSPWVPRLVLLGATAAVLAATFVFAKSEDALVLVVGGQALAGASYRLIIHVVAICLVGLLGFCALQTFPDHPIVLWRVLRSPYLFLALVIVALSALGAESMQADAADAADSVRQGKTIEGSVLASPIVFHVIRSCVVWLPSTPRPSSLDLSKPLMYVGEADQVGVFYVPTLGKAVGHAVRITLSNVVVTSTPGDQKSCP